MNKTLRLVLFLAVVSAISGLAIGVVNSFTEPVINENNRKAEVAYLELMYPETEFVTIDYSDSDKVILGAYEAVDKGYVFKATATGYNGSTPIIALIGMDKKGTITNIIPLQQQETNGFGARCFEAANIKSLYKGKAIDEDVDMLAGATLTSNAMKKMCDKAKEAYTSIGQ